MLEYVELGETERMTSYETMAKPGTAGLPPPFSVEGWPFLADCYVAMHTVCAFSFAAVALMKPDLFSLFCETPITADSVTADCIRWSSPFIFGFSFFAASSMYMDAVARLYIGRCFAAAFAIAVVIGCRTQTTGRWNLLHLTNIALFGTLGVCYLLLTTRFRVALDRTRNWKGT